MSKKMLAAVAFLLLSVVPAMAQEKELSKAELIGRFATFTKANKVNINVELSINDVSTLMRTIVEDDKDLTDAQKSELKTFAKDLLSKLATDTQAALSNSETLAKLGENVVNDVYDKAFTESELKELVAFFSTPLGQKAVEFMATSKTRIEQEFKTRMEKKMQEVSKPLIDASMETFRQRIKDLKKK